MLILCPECAHQCSNKAVSCPNCGYPMKRQVSKRNRSKRRLPNGFGSITYLKGKHLRKPYLARVTIGKTSEGRPIVRNLKPNAYFKTYNDAYTALIEYNRNPYSFDKDISVYDALRLFMDHFGTEDHSDKYVKAVERTYKRCEPLYKMKLRDVRPKHLKEAIDNMPESANEKVKFKQFWNRVFDYAVEYELADHNYARDFSVENRVRKQTATQNPHLSFSDDEMKVLWDNSNDPIVQMILIQCYMGWRPNELVELTKDAVDMNNWSITGGSKTEAGINRVVPVHSKIRPLVESAFNSGSSEYLFMINDKPINYFGYRYYFDKTLKRLGLINHRPHDPRKQFVTMAKRFKVDEYVIKRIIGHSIRDLTESIYTDRDLEWLRSEIEKIT